MSSKKLAKKDGFVPGCSSLFQQGWNALRRDYFGLCAALFRCSVVFSYIVIFFVTKFILRLYFIFMFFFLANIGKKGGTKRNLKQDNTDFIGAKSCSILFKLMEQD